MEGDREEIDSPDHNYWCFALNYKNPTFPAVLTDLNPTAIYKGTWYDFSDTDKNVTLHEYES